MTVKHNVNSATISATRHSRFHWRLGKGKPWEKENENEDKKTEDNRGAALFQQGWFHSLTKKGTKTKQKEFSNGKRDSVRLNQTAVKAGTPRLPLSQPVTARTLSLGEASNGKEAFPSLGVNRKRQEATLAKPCALQDQLAGLALSPFSKSLRFFSSVFLLKMLFL